MVLSGNKEVKSSLMVHFCSLIYLWLSPHQSVSNSSHKYKYIILFSIYWFFKILFHLICLCNILVIYIQTLYLYFSLQSSVKRLSKSPARFSARYFSFCSKALRNESLKLKVTAINNFYRLVISAFTVCRPADAQFTKTLGPISQSVYKSIDVKVGEPVLSFVI